MILSETAQSYLALLEGMGSSTGALRGSQVRKPSEKRINPRNTKPHLAPIKWPKRECQGLLC